MFGKVDSMASPQPSCSKAKLDSLFLQWFSLASTQQLVRGPSNIDDGYREIGGFRQACSVGWVGGPYPLSGTPAPQVLELLDDVKHGRRAALTPAARKGHSPSNQASCRRRRCRSR